MEMPDENTLRILQLSKMEEIIGFNDDPGIKFKADRMLGAIEKKQTTDEHGMPLNFEFQYLKPGGKQMRLRFAPSEIDEVVGGKWKERFVVNVYTGEFIYEDEAEAQLENICKGLTEVIGVDFIPTATRARR